MAYPGFESCRLAACWRIWHQQITHPPPCSQFSGTACCLARLSVTHRLMLELSPGLFSSVRHMLVHSARAPAQLGAPAMISACFRMFRISHVSPGSSSGVRPFIAGPAQLLPTTPPPAPSMGPATLALRPPLPSFCFFALARRVGRACGLPLLATVGFVLASAAPPSSRLWPAACPHIMTYHQSGPCGC